MKKVLVTGGTGKLGHEVVRQLLNEECHVGVLSSREDPSLPECVHRFKGDLVAENGLHEAVENAEIIIHCASSPKDAQKVDVEGTRNLLKVINKNKTSHFIYVSIAGVDKSTYPYYQAKTKVEKIIGESGIPFSILRATQFHNFVFNLIQAFEYNNGLVTIPDGMQFQPIDIKEVANSLVELSNREPAGLLPTMGGPEVLKIEELVQSYLDVSGRQAMLHLKPIEGERYDLFRSGINLCPSNKSGYITWREFLYRQFNSLAKASLLSIP